MWRCGGVVIFIVLCVLGMAWWALTKGQIEGYEDITEVYRRLLDPTPLVDLLADLDDLRSDVQSLEPPEGTKEVRLYKSVAKDTCLLLYRNWWGWELQRIKLDATECEWILAIASQRHGEDR